MKIDFVHVVLATTVLVLWLVIIVGWLVTCRNGEILAAPGRPVPPEPEDQSPSLIRQPKSAA